MTQVEEKQDANKIDDFEHEILGNVLISYGKISLSKLEGMIQPELDRVSRVLSIKASCKKPSENRVPLLFISCRYTRYGCIVNPTINRATNDLEYNHEIPLSHIHKEIECKFVICNNRYDIIQYSDIFRINLKDELDEEYPRIIWVDFKIEHPEIQDLYWFIRADIDSDLEIHFNSTKRGFKENLESIENNNFKEIFKLHFKQVYVSALTYSSNNISDENLDKLCDPDIPYHYLVANKLLETSISEKKPWYRFAFLMQEITGIRKYFDLILQKIMEDDNEN